MRALRGWATLVLYALAAPALAQGASDCAPPPGTPELLARAEGQILVVGETHGTAETPAAFAEMVCAAAQDGRSVLVALEFLDVAAPALAAWLESDGGPEAVTAFLEDSYWKAAAEAGPDGRTSHAMFAMLDTLRRMRAQGLDIEAAPFISLAAAQVDDPAEDEKAMAANIMEAAAAAGPDLTLVLVGDYHARKTPITPDGPPGERLMAGHLPTGAISLLTLNEGGSAWNCRPECGSHPAGSLASPAGPGIDLSPPGFGGYDGTLNVGAVTASPPLTSADQLN